jgi:hypothetical protein
VLEALTDSCTLDEDLRLAAEFADECRFKWKKELELWVSGRARMCGGERRRPPCRKQADENLFNKH